MHKSGDIIAGRFKVVEANIHPHPKFAVHEVADLSQGRRPCWLKIWFEGVVRYRDQVEACNREVEILRRLTNRCIIPVLDSGWLPGGLFFVLVPKFEGQVMFLAVKQPDGDRNKITVARAVRLGLQLVDAVEEAFEAGVLHRNLHPRGMYYCSGQSLLKVFDFGFAKMIDAAAATAARANGDTLQYRAPEVIRDVDRADIRSEIYAIGANLYFWLCGVAPFAEVGPAELERAIFTRAPMSLRARRGDDAVPAALDAIVLRCLAKQPEDRFQRTEDLYSAIQSVKRSLQARADDERARLAYPTPEGLRLDERQRREVHDVARAIFEAGLDFTLDVELRDAHLLAEQLREHDRRLVRRLSALADRPDLPTALSERLQQLREMKTIL